ncbi:formamidopyrimidine-DNA glycosylase [Phlyctema vagabunda]|uniref:Formamidopyrimidine-DNA glycosylase n=1 Tax=Phlyctema vagabunda TaxID=108571 RepID=A0ABR4PEV9_9HELO
MPEIAEIARIVHHLKKSLVGKTLAKVTALDDANVFGKVGTSGAEFQKSLQGKKVLDAGQQGKYFWLIMSSPPHPVLHFGMTGWIQIRGEPTAYYRPNEAESVEWPPKYWKFMLETNETPKVEVAFTDPRRFGRVRLVDCAAEAIRKTTPLKENGPDPVIDKHIITEEWLETKMRSKHVPVKALLLDQANISGIGNYVGDEILYHAKLHPEQYSDTFSEDQLKQLRTSILHICQTAVDALGDSSKFPKEWIFHHRWGKGKKDAPKTLPTGEKTIFLTVGGRTSFVVPSVQRKTGAVAGDVKKEDIQGGVREEKNTTTSRKRKATSSIEKTSPFFEQEDDSGSANTSASRRKKRAVAAKDEPIKEAKNLETKLPPPKFSKKNQGIKEGEEADRPKMNGRSTETRRTSGRLARKTS